MNGISKVVLTLAAAGVLVPVSAQAQSVQTQLSYQVLPGETGQVAIDSSGFGNNGTLRGGVTRKYGVYRFYSLAKDPRHGRISTPNAPSLNPGTNPFTYSARIKVEPDAVWQDHQMSVLRHGDSETPGGNYKMELVKNSSGVVSVACAMHGADGHGAGYVQGSTGIVINDGHWHIVACSRISAETVMLTVDDRSVQRTSQGIGDLTGESRFLIGCQHQSGTKVDQFVGRLDDITLVVSS